MDYRYQYDKVGNIIWRHTEDGPYQYGYDSLDRLTKATPPVSLQQSETNPSGLPVESYAYDAVHNRTQSQHQPGAWHYNQNNQLLNYGTEENKTAYTYSSLGHIDQETITRNNNPQTVKNYLYNAAERLVEVKENHSTIAKYQYDPFGRRIGKTVNGQTIYFHYSDEGLVAEYDQNGAVIKTYGWEPQGLWGTNPLWQVEQNVFYFFHNDHLGTSQRLTDKNGKTSWAMQSEAFGKTTPKTNNSTTNNLRFPGQYFDEETSNHYNYFRDYSPNLGRYVQSDPIGLVSGVNTYIYSNDNTNKYLDPYGLQDSPPTPCAVLGYCGPTPDPTPTPPKPNPPEPKQPLSPEGVTASCKGKWKKVSWERVFNVICACVWICEPCDGTYVWTGNSHSPNLPRTKGQLIHQGRDAERGDNCICGKPGPETDCDNC